MSHTFVKNFRQLAHAATDADASIAYDAALSLIEQHGEVDTINLERAAAIAQEARASGEEVLTNNMITNPDEAPSTNVHLRGLRMVMALPLANLGVIYLEKSVRLGVFEKPIIERLKHLAAQVISADETDLSAEALTERFDALGDVSTSQ